MSKNATSFVEPLMDSSEAKNQHLYGSPASVDVYREAESFLYREARLLDSKMFRTWLGDMVSKDVRYIVTSTQLRSKNDHRYSLPDQVFLFDDDYYQLTIRVEHDLDPRNWRSDPQEKYCRFVTNIEAFETGSALKIITRSNCLLMRTRRSYQTDQFFCTRIDTLAKTTAQDEFKLESRTIDYPERCVSGHNMLVFL